MLEDLPPSERLVFLLREVFGYDEGESARVARTTTAGCRRLAVRARARIDARTPRSDDPRARRDELADRFLAAARQGGAAARDRSSTL
jgi:RNA polymerase sigma-70 factor, ECF subfamily